MRYRLTGVSLWGVQWEPKDDDREIARRVLSLLEDRRMLWKDFSLEIEEHCVQSATRTRQQLGELLNGPDASDGLRAQIKALQACFRTFMDEAGDGSHWRQWHSGDGTDRLSVALGKLRGAVGVQVGMLAGRYGLSISDDLATIVPDSEGWFFERLGDETSSSTTAESSAIDDRQL
jgi:hypothetical protein